MSESSPEERAPEGQESTDPPGAVSSQNHEEAQAGHGDGGGDAASSPDTGETGETDAATEAAEDSGSRGRPGAASEGSQATGHPENAG